MIQIILNICLAEDHKYAIIKQKIITITVNWELNETLRTYTKLESNEWARTREVRNSSRTSVKDKFIIILSLLTNNWQSSDRANIASDIDVVSHKSENKNFKG